MARRLTIRHVLLFVTDNNIAIAKLEALLQFAMEVVESHRVIPGYDAGVCLEYISEIWTIILCTESWRQYTKDAELDYDLSLYLYWRFERDQINDYEYWQDARKTWEM